MKNIFEVCCERVLCISLRQSSRGEIARAPLRQYSGGEVGVCQSPRWYTEMESDSCQGGSGLPCPLATQEIKARRRVHDDRLPLFTASWPYPYIEQRLTGPANHRKHITEQSWYIISMRGECEKKWGDFFCGSAGDK